MKIGFANENIEKLLQNRPKFYFSILPTDPKPDKNAYSETFLVRAHLKKPGLGLYH